VSFVGTEDAGGGVVSALARALGVALTAPRDPLELVAEHLAGRELLLVLDNLEHLPGAAAVLAGLLGRAPATQVLVTSRRQLGLGTEWLVEVPGLPAAEAVQLFTERARLLRPGFATGAGAAEQVHRICGLVEGVPLAIELAARWVRSAGPRAIADRLAAGLDLLETTAPDVEPRHRSLRAVVDWSWELLTDGERAVLSRLSVLRGGFDLAAAGAVAGAGLPVLAALVDQSLVAAGEDGRYSMHELLRQYAAELLAADPAEESRTRWRHAEHYAALRLSPAEAGIEAENLRVATDWLAERADPVALNAHLLRVWELYRQAGWFGEAQACFGAALRRTDLTPVHRARWQRLLGEASQQLGAAPAARHQLELALAVLGAETPASRAGWLRVLAGQTARRVLPGRQPARRADRREAARERAAAGHTIIEVYWVLQERAGSLPGALRALNDAERAGDLDLVLRARAGVGMLLGTLGLSRLARRHLRAAGAPAGRTEDPLTTCWVSILGGLHWTGAGDWAAVEAAAAQVRDLGRRTPMHRWADEMVLITAGVHYLTGRYPQAAAGGAEGLAAGRDRRDPAVQLWGLMILIETALRVDPADPALPDRLRQAERLRPAGIEAARLHAAQARLHLATGRPEQAWQSVRRADGLVGPGPSVEQYVLEAHAGIAEVCQTLLESEPDRAGLRPTATAAVRRLRRYARTFPMARPRALICTGRQAVQDGRPGRALRAWTRAVRAAEELGMPYERARAHDQLGRLLAPGQRSPLGLDRAGHLALAGQGYQALGCRAEWPDPAFPSGGPPLLGL
jgi:predicted ATPase